MSEMFDEAAGELSKKIVAANAGVKEVPKVQAVGVQFTSSRYYRVVRYYSCLFTKMETLNCKCTPPSRRT